MQINQKSAAAMCPFTVFPWKQLWKGSIPSFAYILPTSTLYVELLHHFIILS